MPHVRRLALFAFILTIGLWSTTRHTATQSAVETYGITDLGTIGGDRVIARDMSPGGFPLVIGSGTTASGDEHAFDGRARGIRDLGTLGGRSSEALGTSAAEQAVGRAQVASGAFHAFRADFSGMHDLGTLGGSESYATAVNDNLVIVGASSMPGDGSTRAFVYENGAMTLLPATLGGPDVVANGINNNREIVGYAQRSGGQPYHAFLYANGATIDLGSLGGTSEALAISDDGVIVGRSQLLSGATHAFRYQNGVMQDLGTLGGASSSAGDVNRDGAIVGWSDTAQGQRHAFLWRDGVMTDLNTLVRPGTGWVLEAATGVDNHAAIVGYGRLNGAVRSFLLSPPLDLSVDLRAHQNLEDTNIPNPHETGQLIKLGVTARSPGGYTATGVTIVDTISGPVEYVDWSGGSCVRDGQRLTCSIPSFDFERDFFVRVRATSAGTFTHTATVSADQPDPDSSNNSATETNTAVSLASLTLTPATVTGGTPSLARVTLTSRTPAGGATIALASSQPDIASVPAVFDVLPESNDGLYREFYVVTQPVSAPVTVQISATYGQVTQSLPLTIMPVASQWPFGDSARQIPGTIQAEDFDEGGEGAAYHDAGAGNDGGAYRATNVDIEATSDAGGGFNVGWTSGGEWLEYTVNVSATGTYRAEARVASPGGGGTFHIEIDGVNKTGSLTVPDTGGWQAWATIAQPVVLDAGLHILRVSFDSSGAGDATGNLNYLRFVATSAPGQTPFGGVPRAVPGTIQAEDFDEGGEGVAYHDAGPSNDGGAYRAESVDIEATGDAGGGYNVGWTSAGEWLEYTVDVAATGTYLLEARTASVGAGGTLHAEVDGVDKTGSMAVPDTGGWQTWTTVERSIALTAGLHVLRVSFDSSGVSGAAGNLNYLRLVAASAPGPTPFGGAARAVPGTIQAEDFDEGGEGVAYHDSGPNNLGGMYRATGVDIESTSDSLGTYNVGWMTAGEWLNYTVSVAQTGTYLLTVRVAAAGAGGTFHVEFGGLDKTGPLTIPNTGGWQNWTDITVTVPLSQGIQSMRFVADENGPAAVFGNLNYFTLSDAAVVPADIVLYTTDLTLHGAWMSSADSSAAGGQKAVTPDVGSSNTSSPLADPTDYVEAAFDALPNVPYRIWLRLRATGDTKFSESVWVQFSDARADGAAIYPIASASGLLVNLEPCFACGVSGWGWQNGAYWLEQPTTLTFGSGGPHTIRIQVREDGAQLDQIVLSPSRYLATAPGTIRNDMTIVPK